MQTFGPILAIIWWIVAGMIGFNMVEPESFFGVLGFLVVWHLVWYAPLIFLGGIAAILPNRN